MHVCAPFFLYFDIIKGSAYGSYSLRTVFASIVCGPWFSGVFGVRLLNPLDCSVLKENFASCLDRFVRLLTAVPFSRRTLPRVWIDLCDYWTVSFSRRTLLRVWIDLCDYWTVPFSGENFASCLDRFVRLLTAVPFSRRTLPRVWIDLCDYWTVPFSGENFASCLDRFVRLLTAVPFSGENFASCLDRFVRLLTAVPFSRRTLLRVWIDLCEY